AKCERSRVIVRAGIVGAANAHASPSPGGGGSRAKRAGWGELPLLAQEITPPRLPSLRSAVDPPPPGEGEESQVARQNPVKAPSPPPATASSRSDWRRCRRHWQA